jgi:hypothetical protein
MPDAEFMQSIQTARSTRESETLPHKHGDLFVNKEKQKQKSYLHDTGSSWTLHNYSARQAIPYFTFTNLKVHHHVHKIPPMDSILSQLNLVQTVSKTNFNIILSPTPGLPVLSSLQIF